MVVTRKGEEGAVMAELKRKWKYDVENMTEIVAAAEVEEMLTPERCEAFAFSRPFTAAEAQHVEELYLSDEFGRDKEKTTHFLSQASARPPLALALPRPTKTPVPTRTNARAPTPARQHPRRRSWPHPSLAGGYCAEAWPAAGQPGALRG